MFYQKHFEIVLNEKSFDNVQYISWHFAKYKHIHKLKVVVKTGND